MHHTTEQITVNNGYALPIFAHSAELWNLPCYSWTMWPEGPHYCSHYLRNSGNELKLDGMKHSTMKQMTDWNSHAQPISGFYWTLCFTNVKWPRVLSSSLNVLLHFRWIMTQIAKFMGQTWGPPGSCWPQMGPMLAPWTLLSGETSIHNITDLNRPINQL